MTISLHVERCKGCTYCIMACPQKALNLGEELNQMGYQVIKVNDEKCVSCGICYTVCPELVFELK